MDHRQARKTGWTIIVCGCFFIILSQLWVGLAMAALGLLLIILGGRCPHCGKILLLVPTSATQCPRCHGSLLCSRRPAAGLGNAAAARALAAEKPGLTG